MSHVHTDTNTVGRTVGATAAHAEHFVRVAAAYVVRETGKTGRGVAFGYATTAAERATQRATHAALRLAANQPSTPIGVLETA